MSVHRLFGQFPKTCEECARPFLAKLSTTRFCDFEACENRRRARAAADRYAAKRAAEQRARAAEGGSRG